MTSICASYRRSENHEDSVKHLFRLQERLFDEGARNFLFIDVPPVHQTPAGKITSQWRCLVRSYTIPTSVPIQSSFTQKVINSNANWNMHLRDEALAFSVKHPNATVLLFSSWTVFDEVYVDPSKFGFPEAARKQQGGQMWWDRLHPTSAMHKIIADRLISFLSDLPVAEPTKRNFFKLLFAKQ